LWPSETPPFVQSYGLNAKLFWFLNGFWFWMILVLLVFSSWKENGKACIDNKGWEKNFATQKHRFHNYVVIIHSFGSKPVHVVHLFGSVTGTRIYVSCVVKLCCWIMLINLIVLLKIWCEEGKKRKEQTICFVLQRGMQGNLFIPEL
jgi:hypothetical protein